MSMSADGDTVAIGAKGNDGNGNGSGHVRIYGWCTSSDLVEPFDTISKRHFSAGDFSSLTC